ncbi:transposase [Streptomyces lunaelactis]|uniref:transposase n=1 Tax=Streptomyces lunaelactis TaxID=1535768 RepID=UPI000D3855A2|nr:transposase [Streptomyces lunaelactis]
MGADGVDRDGGQKVAGRKGQVVDCLGLLLAVLVTAASVQDRDAAMPLLQRLRELHRRITLVWADGGYADSSTGARTRLRLALTIVKRWPRAATPRGLRHPRPERCRATWCRGSCFRFPASCQRPEFAVQPLTLARCGDFPDCGANTSAQVRPVRTTADGNAVELIGSGFSPLGQSPESAPAMRRFCRSEACTVGRVGLEPTADGL